MYILKCVLFFMVWLVSTTFVHTCYSEQKHIQCDNLTDALNNWNINWRLVYIGKTTDTPQYDFFNDRDVVVRVEELNIFSQLINIRPFAFSKGFPQLRVLNIVGNTLTNLAANSFTGLTLNQLYLKENNISTIEKNAFQNFSAKLLDLSGNSLSIIERDQLSNINGLYKLRLNDNLLQYFEPNSLPTSLKALELQSNDLVDINKNALSPLSNLQTLNLANNRLKFIYKLDTLRNLVELNLSNNSITTLEQNVFTHCEKLEILNLRDNKIMYFAALHLAPNSAIVELNIANNYLVALDDKLADNLNKLRTISMFGNPWICKCLHTIEDFLGKRGVTKPECELNIFGQGKAPVCLVYQDKCTHEINLTQELPAIISYLEIVKNVKC